MSEKNEINSDDEKTRSRKQEEEGVRANRKQRENFRRNPGKERRISPKSLHDEGMIWNKCLQFDELCLCFVFDYCHTCNCPHDCSSFLCFFFITDCSDPECLWNFDKLEKATVQCRLCGLCLCDQHVNSLYPNAVSPPSSSSLARSCSIPRTISIRASLSSVSSLSSAASSYNFSRPSSSLFDVGSGLFSQSSRVLSAAPSSASSVPRLSAVSSAASTDRALSRPLFPLVPCRPSRSNLLRKSPPLRVAGKCSFPSLSRRNFTFFFLALISRPLHPVNHRFVLMLSVGHLSLRDCSLLIFTQFSAFSVGCVS